MHVEKRIKQVTALKVPFFVKSGNHIPKEPQCIIAQFLESDAGRIPEVMLEKNVIMEEGIEDLGIPESAAFYKEHRYYPILLKLRKYPVNETPDFYSKDNTVTHAVYDPVADMTYFFLLPK